MDAINPTDRAILWTRLGGVTTSLILPGSGNAMGGEATVIKHKNSTYLRDLLLPNAPRALKFACGENPKRVYGMQGQTPMSRMGVAWVFREAFERARTLHLAQRDWCTNLYPTTEYPTSLALEALVALLRGEARLHHHCYRAEDFQMALRVAEEFGYSVSAFHHALEAWKIPALLQNITVATVSGSGHTAGQPYRRSASHPPPLFLLWCSGRTGGGSSTRPWTAPCTPPSCCAPPV